LLNFSICIDAKQLDDIGDDIDELNSCIQDYIEYLFSELSGLVDFEDYIRR